jgi:hypothetical protein
MIHQLKQSRSGGRLGLSSYAMSTMASQSAGKSSTTRLPKMSRTTYWCGSSAAMSGLPDDNNLHYYIHLSDDFRVCHNHKSDILVKAHVCSLSQVTHSICLNSLEWDPVKVHELFLFSKNFLIYFFYSYEHFPPDRGLAQSVIL